MTEPRHHLADLDASATDEQLGRAICGHLLNAHNPAGPFKLGYKFDATKDAPPLKCDVLMQGHQLCTIERKDKEFCRMWILSALTLGLYVQRFADWRTPVAGGSIKRARETIATRARMADFDAARTINPDDDEIPF
jgi:hypothetical protein